MEERVCPYAANSGHAFVSCCGAGRNRKLHYDSGMGQYHCFSGDEEIRCAYVDQLNMQRNIENVLIHIRDSVHRLDSVR